MAAFFIVRGKTCVDLNSVKTWSSTSGHFPTHSVSKVEHSTIIVQFIVYILCKLTLTEHQGSQCLTSDKHIDM